MTNPRHAELLPYQKQPPSSAPLRQHSSISKGLVAASAIVYESAWLKNAGRVGATMPGAGMPATSVDRHGKVVAFSTANNTTNVQVIQYPGFASIPSLPLSGMVTFIANATTGANVLISNGGENTTSKGWRLYQSTTSLTFGLGGVANYGANVSLVTGVPYVAVFTVQGTTYTAWARRLDTNDVTSASNASVGTFTAAVSGSIAVGAGYTGSAWNNGFGGDIGSFAVWDRCLGDAEVRSLLWNPYQIWGIPDSTTLATTSSGVNVTLTGLSATGSVGTPTVSAAANVALTGLSATGSVGTATSGVNISTALTGFGMTGSVGTTTQSGAANVTLSGLSATASLGTVIAGISVTVPVTGLSATGSVGTTTQAGKAGVTLAGLSAAGAVGATTQSGTANTTLAGVSAAGSVGSATVAGKAGITLAGIQAAGALGSPLASGVANLTLDGVQCSTVLGIATGGPYTRFVNVVLDWDLRMTGKLGSVVAVKNQFGVQSGALNTFTSDGQATLGSGWKSTPLM
jgi:hypothetical protein